MKPKFKRKDWKKLSRLGRKRPKLRKWRRPKGRHSKVRLKRRGYAKMPSIGYQKPAELKGLVKGLRAIRVSSIEQLEAVKPGQGVIIARLGAKKKIELLKRALELQLPILNLNAKKWLEQHEKKPKAEEEKKEIKEEKPEKGPEAKPEVVVSPMPKEVGPEKTRGT